MHRIARTVVGLVVAATLAATLTATAAPAAAAPAHVSDHGARGAVVVGATGGRPECDDEGEHADDHTDGSHTEIDDSTCTPTPPPALPETPFAALLPASAVCVGAVAVFVRRRRRTR